MKKKSLPLSMAVFAALLAGGGFIYQAAQDIEAHPWVMLLCPFRASVQNVVQAAPETPEAAGAEAASEESGAETGAEAGEKKEMVESWSGKYTKTEDMSIPDRLKERKIGPLLAIALCLVAFYYVNDMRLKKAAKGKK